jgi:predicted amidophosphoribosyltransferase
MALQQTSIQIGNASYPHYYLCHYLPVSTGRDSFSHSLLKFKESRQPDLSGWIDCTLDALATLPILPGTTILRALHHDETAIRQDKPTALDKMGKALAARFRSDYRPSLLRKYRPTREIKGFSKEQRTTELQDTYYYIEDAAPQFSIGDTQSPIGDTQGSIGDEHIPPGDGHFLLLDDILTTGTTIRAIIAAILLHYPKAQFSIFTLARATYDARSNSALPLKGQNYQLEQDKDWILAEEDADYYPDYSALQLMNWIDTDRFPG